MLHKTPEKFLTIGIKIVVHSNKFLQVLKLK